MNQIKYYGLTFIGRRKNNEDAILQLRVDDDTWCFAVADGMGGAEAGEVASSEVLEQVKTTLNVFFGSKSVEEIDLKKVVEDIFNDAQKRIAEIVEKQPELDGMGTTLTLLLIHKEHYVWGNIGDSRIYLVKGESIEQITNDHTFIEQYKKEHNAEVPESVANRYGNIITRAITGNEDKADIFPEDKSYEELQEGDVFLLCSDGLITSKIADSGPLFLPYLYGYKKLKIIAEQLIALAFNDGSTDNISVIIVVNKKKQRVKVKKPEKMLYPPVIDSLPEGESGEKRENSGSRLKIFFKSPLKIVALLLIIAIVVLGYQYFNPRLRDGAERYSITIGMKISNSLAGQKELITKSVKGNAGKDSAEYNVGDLRRLRKESLLGISKLLGTFLKDPRVKKGNQEHPLAYLIKDLNKDKPDYLKGIYYIGVKNDSTDKSRVEGGNSLYQYVLADTLSKKYPYFVNGKHLLLNKVGKNRYVIISYGNLGKITQQDYKKDMSVFAWESGLKSLTILLANIYIEYYHPANLEKDLYPLLQYLVIYDKGKTVSNYGRPVEKDFNEKAKITRVFYIQDLKRSDGKECIDICVPVPGKKEKVLRAGYLIN